MLKLSIYKYFNELHSSNILFRVVTDEVSKLFKFKYSKDLHLKNILSIFVTEEVFVLFKSIEINDIQF